MSSSLKLDNSLLLKQKRSEAAKKGWETRRKNKAGTRVIREAHNGKAIDYAIGNLTAEISPEKFLKKCKPEVLRLGKNTEKPFKIQEKLHCEFQLINRETGQLEK